MSGSSEVRGFKPLTGEEREHACKRSVEVRRARAALKEGVANGSLAFADALEDPLARKITVIKLLQELPGVGPVTAARIMHDARIVRRDIKIGGMGPRQKERLLAAVAPYENKRQGESL